MSMTLNQFYLSLGRGHLPLLKDRCYNSLMLFPSNVTSEYEFVQFSVSI